MALKEGKWQLYLSADPLPLVDQRYDCNDARQWA
jgi:hypothetical protein